MSKHAKAKQPDAPAVTATLPPHERLGRINEEIRRLDSQARQIENELAAQQQAEQARREAQRREQLQFWPQDKPLPKSIPPVRRMAIPCPACRRVRLANLSPAVVFRSRQAKLAYLRCRACGHTFKLAVG